MNLQYALTEMACFFCVQVTVLVEFLINNCSEIFEEDIAFPACALAEESPEHTDSSTGMQMDWGCHQLGLLGQIIEFDM